MKIEATVSLEVEVSIDCEGSQTIDEVKIEVVRAADAYVAQHGIKPTVTNLTIREGEENSTAIVSSKPKFDEFQSEPKLEEASE